MDGRPSRRPVGLPCISAHAHRRTVGVYGAAKCAQQLFSTYRRSYSLVPDQRLSGRRAAVAYPGAGLLLWSPASERRRGSGVTRARERNRLKQITFHLDELLESRGLTLTELANRVDITLVNLSVLKNNRAKAIRFSTLEALCKELDCQPGDLMTYE